MPQDPEVYTSLGLPSNGSLTTEAAAPMTTEERPSGAPQSPPTRRVTGRGPKPSGTPKEAPRAQPGPANEAERKPWEEWAKIKRTPEIDRRRAPPFNGWAAGRYVTEAEFDSGVHAAANCLIR
jgi:hypothetical protein